MLAFAKVSVLPASLTPNTFYFIAESDYGSMRDRGIIAIVDQETGVT